MNIFIAILLAVMAGVIFCQNWQMAKFRKGVVIYRYYSKLQENRAIHADEAHELALDLIKQLGYNVDRLITGDMGRQPLTEEEAWAIHDRMNIRRVRLKVADEELEEAERIYNMNK